MACTCSMFRRNSPRSSRSPRTLIQRHPAGAAEASLLAQTGPAEASSPSSRGGPSTCGTPSASAARGPDRPTSAHGLALPLRCFRLLGRAVLFATVYHPRAGARLRCIRTRESSRGRSESQRPGDTRAGGRRPVLVLARPLLWLDLALKLGLWLPLVGSEHWNCRKQRLA